MESAVLPQLPQAQTVPTPGKWDWEAIFWLAFVHLGAAAAIPLFSWSALWVCLALLFTVSPLGVTLGYHRLLTHRAFKVPRWLEYSLATVGVLSAQGSPLLWVGGHRLHHRHSDTEQDPHDARRGFAYAHIGHFFYRKPRSSGDLIRHAPDLARRRFYRFLDRYHLPIAFSALPVLYWFGGWKFVFWGGFMRVALMLHITWLVNSATHTFGYRNYPTPDNSRNCWWVALLAAGEGWHNNHHAEQSCAAHGRKWWELDLTYQMIRALERLGLATGVKHPKPMKRGAV